MASSRSISARARNAFRHARARHIEAEISFAERVFRLRIRDNGDGIPAEILEQGRPGHHGLRGIRERARQIGADVTIWSRAGTGTEIELSLAGSVATAQLHADPVSGYSQRK